MSTEWFKQMRSVDDSIGIYDYQDKKPTRCIHKPKQVPSDISNFKHYFAYANPLPKGVAVWLNLWIGHTDFADNIKVNIYQTTSKKAYSKRVLTYVVNNQH